MIKQLIKKYFLITAACFLLWPLVPIAESHPSDIWISEGYIRQMPPGQNITAAFMTLKNLTPNLCRLVGASSDIAKKTEIHNHFKNKDVMSMRPVKSINIPAGEIVSLKPGGYHLMMFGLNQELKENQYHQITLNFTGCSNISFNAPVRSVRQHHH